MSGASDIAIIGGGFAGTMLAVQLAAKAERPLNVTLYDQAGGFARGVAYGTRNPSHLLNVPAGRMGAFADKLGDFHRWLSENGYPAQAGEFMPRMLYGAYIESLLEEARRNERVRIHTVKAEVTDAAVDSDGITLTLADGSLHKAARLALALGSLPTQPPRFAKPLARPERYVGNVWSPPQGSLLTRTGFTPADEPVLIIGTGLTMIDVILSLCDAGYGGKIIAVSRNGLTPQQHAPAGEPYPPFLFPATAPRTALGLLRAIRAKAKGDNWRAVIDSLRNDTPALWAALPEPERKKLLRVLSVWNVHRHRMPPQSASMLAREIQSGTLMLIAGSIREIEETPEGFIMPIRRKGSGETVRIAAAHLLNCAGPVTDIRRSGNKLLLTMLQRGLITPGPLGMGLAAREDYSLRGSAHGRLFALGPLLVGERLETVAVPELRQQAETAAKALLASLSA